MKDKKANFKLNFDEIDIISMACVAVQSHRLKSIRNQDFDAILYISRLGFWHGHFESFMRNAKEKTSTVWLGGDDISEITKILKEYQAITSISFNDRIELAKETVNKLNKQADILY